MSGLELLVIAAGALAGYWLVSFLFLGKRRPGAQPPTSQAPGDEASGDRQPSPLAPSWEEVLGVSSVAGIDEIRSAYQRLLSQYHPDKVATLGPELRELANRKSQEITQAYRSAMAARGDLP